MKCQHELRRRTGQRTDTQSKISKDHSYFFLKQPRQSHGATFSGTPRADSSVTRPGRILSQLTTTAYHWKFRKFRNIEKFLAGFVYHLPSLSSSSHTIISPWEKGGLVQSIEHSRIDVHTSVWAGLWTQESNPSPNLICIAANRRLQNLSLQSSPPFFQGEVMVMMMIVMVNGKRIPLGISRCS